MTLVCSGWNSKARSVGILSMDTKTVGFVSPFPFSTIFEEHISSACYALMVDIPGFMHSQ